MLDLNRRDVVQGAAVMAAFAALASRSASAFPSRPGETVVPWLDQPPPMDDPTRIGASPPCARMTARASSSQREIVPSAKLPPETP